MKDKNISFLSIIGEKFLKICEFSDIEDEECLECRHHRNGGRDTWCENNEMWTPLNRNEYAKIVHAHIVETVENGRFKRVCSNCNSDITTLTQFTMPNYCIKCGAKMDL